MKRIASLILVLTIFTVSSTALAESNWWSKIGTATQTATPEQTDAPSEKVKGFFGGLMDGDKPSPSPEPTPEITEPPTIEEPVPEEEGDGYDQEYWDNVLFGPDVVNIRPNLYGGQAQYVDIGNWSIAYGLCDDHYCVFGWNHMTSEYNILAETVVSDIVSTKDRFAYYGEVKSGKFGWLTRDPDEEKPVSLGLSELDSIFWSDEDYFYYFTYGKGAGATLSRMDHDGKNRKKLGQINGRAVAMTPDGSVIVFNTTKNRIQLWKDGKHETIYDPKETMSNIVSTGRDIWVSHDGYFGLLEEGEITFRFDGTLRSYAIAGEQVFVIVDDGTARLKVRMLNGAYQAHAIVGEVIAQDGLTIEVTPGWENRIVAWGARESLSFYTPYANEFLPYGYHDMDSAKADGWVGGQGYDGDPGEDVPEPEPAEDSLMCRISPELLSGDELAEWEKIGVTSTEDRDGNYTLFMNRQSYETLLAQKRAEITGVLDAMLTLGDGASVKSYDVNDDLSEITLRVDGKAFQEDMATILLLTLLAKYAPAHQALLGDDVINPQATLIVIDDNTGKEAGRMILPDDILGA